MTSFVAFIIGMLIGGALGILFMCLVSYNRYNEMDKGYEKLRNKLNETKSSEITDN